MKKVLGYLLITMGGGGIIGLLSALGPDTNTLGVVMMCAIIAALFYGGYRLAWRTEWEKELK